MRSAITNGLWQAERCRKPVIWVILFLTQLDRIERQTIKIAGAVSVVVP